ncbi:hypothetical protein DWW12_05040 [Collinsella sp. AF14-35]|nr:hypothetical protein DWW12_05040 [Collinsella sp. AF14-35]
MNKKTAKGQPHEFHTQCDKGTVPLSHLQKWARQRRAHSLNFIQPA